MRGMGQAMMGTGRASGENRARVAAQAAISSPLLEDVDIAGAQAVLVNVLGAQVGMRDTSEAMSFIEEAAGPQAHVIFGFGTDESLGDTLQVTVIATGFTGNGAATPHEDAAERHAPPPAAHAAATVAAPEPEEPVVAAPESEPEQEREEAPELEFAAPPVPAASPAATVAPPEPPAASQERSGPVSFEGFLRRGPEPAADEAAGEADGAEEKDGAAPQEELQSPFLRTVGRRTVGHVDVPESRERVVPQERGATAGYSSDRPGEDLSQPAYSRKYMD